MTGTDDTNSPSVSIIVVNWNGASILPRCLAAISAQTFTNYEVIVVDNASSDGSADEIEQRWPRVRVIRLEENSGFAAANNLAAQEARGHWLALLNNDAFPEAEWLANLVQAAKNQPAYACFASCLLQAHNPDYIDSSGDICHTSGLAWNRGKGRLHSELQGKSMEVFSPCAAAALYLREAFLLVGGFDNHYFSHHEDIDLGFRLRLLGWRCLLVPDAVAKHIGSASFGGEVPETIYRTHCNMVWTYFKNMPGYLVWRYLPAHLAANLVFLIYYSLKGQGKAIWHAKWDAWRNLPRVLKQRREIQERRTTSCEAIRQVLDHGLLNPYLLGKNAERLRSWLQPFRIKRI